MTLRITPTMAGPRTFHALSALAAALLLTASRDAAADRSVIKHPGQHPDYSFEAEPHILLGVFDPPGPGDGDNGFGLGFRGTVEIVDNGFIKSINNTVGIGFGLDWIEYDGEVCHRNRNNVWCDDDEWDYLWVPVVMQWNFWLSENWSVFGEPGLALRLDGPGDDDIDPFIFYAGGRWHFSESASLTMRIGHPTFSVGVSFFL